jgi:type III secretion protein V
VGVGQRGMEVTLALKRYGLLTIGDGLVTQIPALVLSTAAGVLVTRTASEEAGTPLGAELARQLFGIPRAMGVAAGFVLALALVPGLPAAPFLVLAVGLAVAARARGKTLAHGRERERVGAPRDRADGQFIPVVVPWGVEVSEDLAPLLSTRGARTEEREERDASILAVQLKGVRERLFAELGVPLPSPHLSVQRSLFAGHARIVLFEVPGPAIDVLGGQDEAEPAALVASNALTTLRLRAADFLGLAETQRLLDELEQLAPALVRSVVPKPVPLTLLSDVLRRLVEERVGVRDLRAVLEALVTVVNVSTTERDPLALSEHVRTQLRRPITFRLTGGAPQLGVYLLDPLIEETIRRAVTRTPSGAFLTLPPASARDVVASIGRAFGETAPPEGRPRVVLTQPDIRRFVRKLLELDFPEAEVVSFAELLPEVNLRPLARANLVGL